MLGSESFNIDTNNAFEMFEPPNDYSRSLRDMIGVYSVSKHPTTLRQTIHTVCTPHAPDRTIPYNSTGVPFELSATGSDWVERFFGVSRPMIILIGQVNRLVGVRLSLLRQGLQGSFMEEKLRKEAEELITSLNSGHNWQEEWIGGFKTRRIERGSLVSELLAKLI
jgi:hypothetical protein